MKIYNVGYKLRCPQYWKEQTLIDELIKFVVESVLIISLFLVTGGVITLLWISANLYSHKI